MENKGYNRADIKYRSEVADALGIILDREAKIKEIDPSYVSLNEEMKTRSEAIVTNKIVRLEKEIKDRSTTMSNMSNQIDTLSEHNDRLLRAEMVEAHINGDYSDIGNLMINTGSETIARLERKIKSYRSEQIYRSDYIKELEDEIKQLKSK